MGVPKRGPKRRTEKGSEGNSFLQLHSLLGSHGKSKGPSPKTVLPTHTPKHTIALVLRYLLFLAPLNPAFSLSLSHCL